jgi:hypothetical protein
MMIPMLNIANELDGLEIEKPMRECNEINGSTYGGLSSLVVTLGEGSSSIGESTTSSSTTSSKMAIKCFCSLHLCLGKCFSSQL